MMWVPAVTEMAWHDHVAVVPLLRLGCTPGKWLTSGSGKCDAWFEWVLGQAGSKVKRATYVGRAASAATATGPMSRHMAQLKAFLDEAFVV